MGTFKNTYWIPFKKASLVLWWAPPPTPYSLGKIQADCFGTLNKLPIYSVGHFTLAASVKNAMQLVDGFTRNHC